MKLYYYFLPALLLFSCAKDEVRVQSDPSTTEQQDMKLQTLDIEPLQLKTTARRSKSVSSVLNSINNQLTAQGAPVLIEKIEYYSHDGAGNTVFFNDRGNKQLGSDFVPNDPRRFESDDIFYIQDGAEASTASGLSGAQTIPAINSAMNTWDGVTCSKGLDIVDVGVTPFDLGYVQFLIGLGGAPLFTDMMHSGFTTGLFNFFFGAGSSVLGVTFTLVWIDGAGNPTDIDNNGKSDVALKDIYYNDAFAWNIGANIDVETVALHEAGHGLSQGHFGKLFQDNGSGQFHFAPRAVMNAGYTGVQTSIAKTDKAGHCSNWAQWPNN